LAYAPTEDEISFHAREVSDREVEGSTVEPIAF
jgi:hypothetical protein